MARPTKLDDLVEKKILDATAKGLPRDTVAKLARIHPATLFEWLAKGRAGQSPYAEFHDRVKEAEAKGEEELVGIIREAAGLGTWQAAAWMLERRRPERYALQRLTAKAPVAEPVRASGDGKADLALAESVVAALRSASEAS